MKAPRAFAEASQASVLSLAMSGALKMFVKTAHDTVLSVNSEAQLVHLEFTDDNKPLFVNAAFEAAGGRLSGPLSDYEIVQHGNGVAFKHNGKFLCAEPHEPRLICDREEASEWERFFLFDTLDGLQRSLARYMNDLLKSVPFGRFISMGENCEFGFAQRATGAEPLDLLRWGQTDMAVVIHMLRDRFAHIGDPAALDMSVTRGEYILHNSFYGFLWHTFAMEGAVPRDRVLRRELTRLPRQAEMLLSDIAEGHRILVRIADQGIHEGGLDEFVLACGDLGPSQILFVTSDPARAGTAERVGPTLLRGYVRQLADGDDVPGTTDVLTWVDLCRSALAIVDGT